MRTSKALDRAPMRLRSSDIITPETAREVSGRAKRRTPGASPESWRLAARAKLARLCSVADAA
jgi:hypothetical protein